MNTLLSLMMYGLWILTIVFVLATTFTDFKYEDLNLITAILLVVALINTFLFISRRKT